MVDLEEAQQIREIMKMMETPGWGLSIQLLGLEREKNIKKIKNAKLVGPNQEHGYEWYQGLLEGFDSVVAVFDRIKMRNQEIIEDSQVKETDGGQ